MSKTPKHQPLDQPTAPLARHGGPSKTEPSEGGAIERLLRLAGPRPGVPHDTESRVREASREAWNEALSQGRRRHYLWAGLGLAAAASLTFALIVVPPERPGALEPPRQVATLHAATGDVVRTTGELESRELRSGGALFAGDRIETGADARVALTLSDGASLRLDHSTSLRMEGQRRLLLERGGIYFDSADDPLAAGALEVRTDLGVVRDIGTQFEVRRDHEPQDGQLRVRVRQGLVHLDRAGVSHEAGAGFELRVSEGGGLSRHSTPVFGPSWDWILDVAPTFSLEGHTLDAFLAWVSRETGWQTEFADAAVADSAAGVVLHGSIEGLRPDRALDAVLPTCGLEHRFEGGILLIEAESR